MKRRARHLLALVGGGVALRAADTTLFVPTENGSNVTIKLTSPLTGVPRFGFVPVKIAIENLAARDGVWKFRFNVGAPASFPGVATSTLELAVPAAQTRESWFFVPIAEPGVSHNPAAALLSAPPGSLLGSPPTIDTVWPNSPAGVGRPTYTVASSPGRAGILRTYTISQRGPAAKLPALPAAKLPPNATMNLTPPDAAGVVTRTTVVTVESASGAMSGAGASSLALSGPSVFTRTGSMSLSGVGGSVGTSGSGGRGTLTFSTGAPSMSYATTATSSAAAEAEARKALDPTGLLKLPPGVTMGPAQFRNMMVTHPAGGSTPNPAALVIFEQLGPPAALGVTPPAGLPPAVRVMVHPTGVAGQVMRAITFADLNYERALAVSVTTGTTGREAIDRMNLARFELMRLGYLRYDGKIQQSQSQRSSSPVLTSADIHIFMESGPPNLLPEPPPGVLPAGITCKMTPGVLPGETTRNFIVDTTAIAKGIAAPGAGSAAAGGGATSVGSRVMPTSGMNLPPSLTIEATGPGIASGRVPFPVSLSTLLPPMAVSANLEAALRAQLAAARLRQSVNFAAVEPGQLPADWRVWSSFNAVVLNEENFVALSAAHRAALRGWVALGGVLFVNPILAGEEKVENLGAGRIEKLALPIADTEPRDLVATLQLATLSPGLPDRELLRFGAGTPMDNLARAAGADVVWLIVFLVAFALLIGPVNLFLLAPAGKRHRLFLTMPLLSLLGAVAVAGAIVFQDGFGGDGARRALVVLVPGENQAAVFQEQAVHTGFLLRRDFPLEDRMLFAVLPTEDALLANPATPPQFNRDQGRATGDWFRNRARQAHLLRHLVPTRARVEFVGHAPGGAPIVESTLATELRNFHLRDDRDGYWFASSLGPGRRVTLQLELPKAAEAAARDFGGDGTPAFTSVLGAAALRDAWHWRAEGGATELAPLRTLAAVRWQDHPVVYAGVAERSSPSQPRAAATEKGGQ